MLNEAFVREGEDATYYGFSTSGYIPHLGETFPGFEIFNGSSFLECSIKGRLAL